MKAAVALLLSAFVSGALAQGLTCFSGSVTRDLHDDLYTYDSVQQHECGDGENRCFRQTILMGSGDRQIEIINGGCYNEENADKFSEENVKQYFPSDDMVESYNFDICKTSNCFEFGPEYRQIVTDPETGDFVRFIPSTTCNSGLKVTDQSTGEVLFFHQEEQHCHIHKTCESNTVTLWDNNNPGQGYYFEWSGCGDPFYSRFPFNPLPFVPASNNQDETDQQCEDFNCHQIFTGLCSCPRDVNVNDLGFTVGQDDQQNGQDYQKDFCYHPVCNGVQWSERTCMAGVVTQEAQSDQYWYDDTHIERCNENQTMCYKLTFDAVTADGLTVRKTMGGCLGPDNMEHFNQQSIEEQFPQNVTLDNWDFQACDEDSNCFDFRPQDSFESITCYTGLTIYDLDNGNKIYNSEHAVQCRNHKSCESYTYLTDNGLYVYSQCGDPFGSEVPTNPLPYFPESQNAVERSQFCKDQGCSDYMLGMCSCPRDFETGNVDGPTDKDTCYEPLCNGGGNENLQTPSTCWSGFMYKDMNTGVVLYDDMNQENCNSQETKCYSERTVVSGNDTETGENWHVVRIYGGCLNPWAENIGQLHVAESYMHDNSNGTIEEFSFDVCDTNCCNGNAEGCYNHHPYPDHATEKTVSCYSGLHITDLSSQEVIFSSEWDEQCRVHKTCETITMNGYHPSTGQALHYRYSGCGDPYYTKQTWINSFPYVPPSEDNDIRQMTCYQHGCHEATLGLCVCPQDVDVSNFTVVSGYNKEFCYEPLCNGNKYYSEQEYAPFTCIAGAVHRDPNTGMVTFDDTREEHCNVHETKCFIQHFSASTHHGQAVQVTNGGCINPANEGFFNLDVYQNFWMENVTVTDYEFNTCAESNCFDHRPQEQNPTLSCYAGLTVHSVSDGFLHFTSQQAEQCKEYKFCESVYYYVDLPSRNPENAESTEQYVFKYTGCGDPANTKYDWSNNFPFIPPKEDEEVRDTYCNQVGCYEGFLGMCVCPTWMDLSSYPQLSEFNKESCYESLCNGEQGEESLTCWTGTVHQNSNGQVMYDDTHQERCSPQETQCYKFYGEASSDSWQGKWTNGGCLNPRVQEFYTQENMVQFMPVDINFDGYDFDTCNESNCFYFTPAESAQQTTTCYTGLSVHDADSHEMLFSSHYPEQCRVFKSCETEELYKYDFMTGRTYHFQWRGCGDPYNMRHITVNMSLPYIPPNEDEDIRETKCAEYGCYEERLGLCVCSRDFDINQYYSAHGHKQEYCYTPLCNRADFNELTCMTGKSTYDMVNEMVTYDDTHEEKCSRGQTACYRHIVEVYSDSENWRVRSTEGGCMYPGSESHYSQEKVEQYLPEMAYVASNQFDMCYYDNCFDFTHEHANETVTCYSGLSVTDEHGHVMGSFQEPQQCRLHQSCETVRTAVQFSYTNGTYHFTYSGCGDPMQLKFTHSHGFPVMPVSLDEDLREQQCQQWGCYEDFLGWCACPTDSQAPSDNVRSQSEFHRETCYGPLCNKESSGLTCWSGTVNEDMMSGMVTYDDTRQVECERYETACFMQTVTTGNSDEGWNVKTTSGGCMNPAFEQYFTQESMEPFFPDGIIQSFEFETCHSSNCFYFTPEASEMTVSCYNGLHVTNQSNGEVLFHSEQAQQCRNHLTCETTTFAQVDFATGDTYNFTFSGCGDPYSTKVAFANTVAFLPPTEDKHVRGQKCNEWGCFEGFMGLCYCPQSLNLDDYRLVYDVEKEFCYGDLCNEVQSSLTCMTGAVRVNVDDGHVYYDDTKEESCAVGQTMCYKQSFVVDGSVHVTVGGCMYPWAENYYSDQSSTEVYFPEEANINSYSFESCSQNNCFDISPESGSYQTTACYNGMTARNEEGHVLFNYQQAEQCRVHETCDTYHLNKTQPKQDSDNTPHRVVPLECSFPFTYQGVQYSKCININSDNYWCGTTSNEDVENTDQWTNCNGYNDPTVPDQCSFPFTYENIEYNSCIDYQEDGQYWCQSSSSEWFFCEGYYSPAPPPVVPSECVFPFTYDGVEYNSCTNADVESGTIDTYWCGTTDEFDIYQSGAWVNCDDYEEPQEHQATCVFPFVYQGMEYNDCIDTDKDFHWCSTTYDFDADNQFTWCSSATYDICNDNDAQATSQWSAVYSPNYPSAYNSDHNCNFGIYAPEGSTVVFELMDFHTEAEYDYVHIYDGQDNTSPKLADNLNSLQNQMTFTSSGQYVHFEFVSDGTQQESGFHFRFKLSDEHSTPSAPSQCSFPFTYQGNEYYTCTTVNEMSSGKYWCGTTSNNDVYETDDWIYCPEHEETETIFFKFTGCGDPYDTKFSWANLLPFVPPNADEDVRQEKCMEYGCVEGHMGLCFCPRDFDFEYYNYNVSTPEAEMCDQPFCNKENNGFHCLTGSTYQNADTNEYYYDNTREQLCDADQTVCYQHRLWITHQSGSDERVMHTSYGCLNPAYESLYTEENSEQYLLDGYSFYNHEFSTCQEENCYSTDSQETRMCYTGLNITCDQGNSLFSFQYPTQCKVHDSCETTTLTETLATGETRYYSYTGCGDPFRTTYNNTNYMPFLPESIEPRVRNEQCSQWGCYEEFMGMCVCPNSFNVADYTYVTDMNTTFCNQDFCNEGQQPGPAIQPEYEYPEDDFNCEELYAGTSSCEMRKAWLCDYARWRWTVLSDWLQQFQNFRYENGHDDVHLEMPHCAETSDFMCRDMNMQRCRYNDVLQCNECYCTDHQYTHFDRVMNHWRKDYRSWANVFAEYRRVMQNSNNNYNDNGTC